jgi:hypothetical protein
VPKAPPCGNDDFTEKGEGLRAWLHRCALLVGELAQYDKLEAVDRETCKNCGRAYTLRPECEPTLFCDLCAQAILDDACEEARILMVERSLDNIHR